MHGKQPRAVNCESDRAIDAAISRRLRNRRIELNLTQDELATQVFWSRRVISDMELVCEGLSGRSFKVSEVKRLAAALEMDWQQLMG